jgi:hypothetical protein
MSLALGQQRDHLQRADARHAAGDDQVGKNSWSQSLQPRESRIIVVLWTLAAPSRRLAPICAPVDTAKSPSAHLGSGRRLHASERRRMVRGDRRDDEHRRTPRCREGTKAPDVVEIECRIHTKVVRASAHVETWSGRSRALWPSARWTMRTAPTSNVNVEHAEHWLPPSGVAVHRFSGARAAQASYHHSFFSFRILHAFRQPNT